MILFKDILTFLGLKNRDASRITLYLVAIEISVLVRYFVRKHFFAIMLAHLLV